MLFIIGAANAQSDPTKYGMDINFDLPQGLQVGEDAPDFTAESIEGVTVVLSKELAKGNVVLIFYRGEWCPVCNRYLSNFQDSLQFIKATGAQVFAITPEIAEYAKKMKGKTGATFSVIPDPSEEILKAYDVLFNVTDAYNNKIQNALDADIASNNGNDSAKLPVPATYIINKKGKIVYRQFDYNYSNRASVGDILNNLPK
jgi:peroxiredoxin